MNNEVTFKYCVGVGFWTDCGYREMLFKDHCFFSHLSVCDKNCKMNCINGFLTNYWTIGHLNCRTELLNYIYKLLDHGTCKLVWC